MDSVHVGQYAAFTHQLSIRATEDDASESSSFRNTKTCGIARGGRDVDIITGMLQTIVTGPLLKLARAVGAFRHFVACSRPRMHRVLSVGEEAHIVLKKSRSILYHNEKVEMQTVMNLECMRLELQAVLRHLEVRWQLFNEAMSKWCDLEAMLAICTDNVTWRGGSGVVISGRNSPLLSENLGSLLNRKLSYNVVIERVTRLSPKVLPDLCLDKDGNCIEMKDSELRNASASLDKLLGSDKNDVYIEDGWYKESGPYMVLEKDWYTLQDSKGQIVEQGYRTVLWKQHNSTWYIRACMICPSDKKASLT